MEKQPLHVCQSLLNRISESNSSEISTILRLYYSNRKQTHSEVDAIVSRHFARLLQLNNQVNNRILDDLLLCLPSLGLKLHL